MIKNFLRVLDASISEAEGLVSLIAILFKAFVGGKDNESGIKSE